MRLSLTPAMKLFPIALVSACIFGQLADGQSLRRSQDSYRRFAGAIQTKADSAAGALNAISVSGLSAEEAQAAMPGMLRLAAKRANRLVGDFDAITPPTDFVRLEQQMVEPLRDFASRLDRVASLLSASCARMTSAGVPCNEAELKANSATEAYSQFASIREPIVTYMEVRERAQRMLREHSVDLPEFQE